MRVLHLDAGRLMGGGQWQVLRLVEGLAAEGIESTLLARKDAPLFTAARRAGWRTEPLGLTRARGLLRDHDLVHAHDARTHTMALLLRGKPLLVARRVAFPIGGRAAWASRLKYAAASRYVAVSEYVKKVLAAGGVPAGKIDVVYDGVPLLEPSRGGAVMSLGKGAALARQAAALAGVPIEITGSPEKDLSSASIFVYCTECEGLGSGALLAMSAGVAVVASDVGGLREVIEHGRNGLLVPNGAEAFADGIRRFLRDPEMARRAGANASATIRERFTVERMVRHTMEVYRRVLT